MKKYLDAVDEELAGVQAQINKLVADERIMLAQGQVIPDEMIAQKQALSQQKAMLFQQPRTYICDDCGEVRPQGDQSFLIVREAVVYDSVLKASRVHKLPHEIYVGVSCPDCIGSSDTAEKLGVVASSRQSAASK